MVVWTPRAQLLVTDLPALDGEAAYVLDAQWPGVFHGRKALDHLSDDAGPSSITWIQQLA